MCKHTAHKVLIIILQLYGINAAYVSVYFLKQQPYLQNSRMHHGLSENDVPNHAASVDIAYMQYMKYMQYMQYVRICKFKINMFNHQSL